jgi:protein subunit release factor B
MPRNRFVTTQVTDEKQQLLALQTERRRLEEEIQQLDQTKRKLEKNQKNYIKYYGHQSTQTVDR